MYDFLFVIIELFLLLLTVETLQAEICRHERFLKGGGSLWSPILSGRGRRPPTTVGWQKTRKIALSYGIKILPVGSLDSYKARELQLVGINVPFQHKYGYIRDEKACEW